MLNYHAMPSLPVTMLPPERSMSSLPQTMPVEVGMSAPPGSFSTVELGPVDHPGSLSEELELQNIVERMTTFPYNVESGVGQSKKNYWNKDTATITMIRKNLKDNNWAANRGWFFLLKLGPYMQKGVFLFLSYTNMNKI